MKLAIVGTGPSGIMAAIFALKNPGVQITFFDVKKPLSTLLPTGGGRCNLTYAEFDNCELVKFYPRGQKFLLSVFSRFSTGDTLNFFESIGVNTYIQEDLRIFPISNSSADVREKMLKEVKGAGTKFIKEAVICFERNNGKFKIHTQKAAYDFDRVIFAGGIRNNKELLKNSGIKIIEPKPALCALCISEKSLYSCLAGLSFKNISAKIACLNEVLTGDLLITHKSLSGPLAYKISSLCAYEDFPLKFSLNFVNQDCNDFDKTLISLLNKNSKKDLINIVSDFVPRSFASYLLNKSDIPHNIKASQVNKEIRLKLCEFLTDYKIVVNSKIPDGEIVTAGGVDLDCINPKTMEYRDIPGLYFCGEVLNIDGFTGGFNLQNCWSTGYIAGNNSCR